MRTSVKVLFAAFAVGLLAMPAWAQDSTPTLDDAIAGYEAAAHQSFQGVVTDWSSRHVIFSKPAPGSDAEDKVQQDPRYWMQLIQRRQASSDEVVADGKADKKKKKKQKKVKKVPIKKDWSMNLQGTASTALEGVFAAKFSYPTTSQSCSDFVAYPTGQAPTTAHPSIVGLTALYTGGGCTAPIPTVSWSYNTSAADAALIDTSPVLSFDGKQIAFAEGTHLVLIKLPTSGTIGTLSAPNAIAEQTSAANYTSCVAGTTGCMFAFSITNTDTNSSPYYDFQHDALYVGDDAGVLHKFSPVFNGTPAVVGSPWPVTVDAPDNLTGPVYDITSTNVYVGDSSGFMNQVNSTTGALVQSARIGAGTGTVDVIADPGSADTLVVGTVTYEFHGSSAGCGATANCIIHGGTDTEDAENIEAAINHNATQCGFTSGGACFYNLTVANPGATATNPASAVTTVQNTTLTNLAFTASNTSSLTLAPATLGIAVGMVDAPIVDSGAETVYSFVARQSATTADAGVNQLKLTSGTITGGQTGTFANIGVSSQTTPLYSGSFDNKYFTSTSATPTGTLYVCGNPGSMPTLYGITITAGAVGAVTTGPQLGTGTGTTCSPVTELCNPGTGTCANAPTGNAVDWIFLSIEASVNATRTPSGCTAVAGQGCVMAFNVTAPPITATTNASSSVNETAGTSGIVIDNVVSNSTGGSQVYFTPLGNQTCTGNTSTGSTGSGPCATQASQSGL